MARKRLPEEAKKEPQGRMIRVRSIPITMEIEGGGVFWTISTPTWIELTLRHSFQQNGNYFLTET